MGIKKGDKVKVIGNYYSDHSFGLNYNLPRGEGTVIESSDNHRFIIIQYDNGVVSPPVNSGAFEKIMKFEIGKKYISSYCPGWIYECLGFMDNGDAILYSKKENIRDCINYAKPEDLNNKLYEEYKELKKGTIYLNICENNIYPYHNNIYFYHNKDKADRNAGPDRLACIKVDWTEGEGL